MLRQRCAWCAEILIDESLLDQSAEVGTAPRTPMAWPVGIFLTETDGKYYPVAWAPGQFPPGSCVEIPAELTITYQPGESMFGK